MGLKQYSVFLTVAPVLLVLATTVFSVVSILSIDLRWGHAPGQSRILLSEPGFSNFSDSTTDSIGLRAIALQVAVSELFQADTPELKLKYERSYADLGEGDFAVFSCLGADGAEDVSCAGTQAFVEAVRKVGRNAYILMIVGLIFNCMSFFTVVASRTTRGNKYSTHGSWALPLLAELFLLAALFLWGVRVLNERIDTDGREITAGVGYGLAAIAAILNFVALVVQLVYLKVKDDIELAPSGSFFQGRSAAELDTSAAGKSGAFSRTKSAWPETSPSNAGAAAAKTGEDDDGWGEDDDMDKVEKKDVYDAEDPFGEKADKSSPHDASPFDKDNDSDVGMADTTPSAPPPVPADAAAGGAGEDSPFASSGDSGGAGALAAGGDGAYGDGSADPGW